ncbi:DNA-binding regulatory protein [Corallococcus macrosporus]|uniref:DNA-binding regulatory protein n=1 Tax=Myxococcus fulvus (strain ATCC BAA-855 / HW-1) TaxID=483219 RepID=F8CC11_MYXFH|nr:DNA-binding regulatory protein [Corallococcus macrosporus]AEI67168.1 DNA-binding regulatory protein [Corallococcus macrosporus]
MTAAADPVRAAAEALAAHGVVLDVEGFRRVLASRPPERKGAANLHLVDLALAWAYSQGNVAAIVHFERVYFSHAVRALRRMKLSETLADDVLGWLRLELFARPGGGLMSTYTGRGDLGSWVRAIAVHEALKRARRQSREVTPDAAADLPVPDTGLVAVRGAYGAEFTRALDASFRALTTQQRNLLRQYFLDGLTIDMLARLHDVHRATAARWVVAARTELVDNVRSRLTEELALNESDVDEVITLSNLRESLSQLLRRTR